MIWEARYVRPGVVDTSWVEADDVEVLSIQIQFVAAMISSTIGLPSLLLTCYLDPQTQLCED